MMLAIGTMAGCDLFDFENRGGDGEKPELAEDEPADTGDADEEPVDPDVAAVVDAIRRTYPDDFDPDREPDAPPPDDPSDDVTPPPVGTDPGAGDETPAVRPRPEDEPSRNVKPPRERPTVRLDPDAVARGSAKERLERLIATLDGMDDLSDGAQVKAERVAKSLETIRAQMVREDAARGDTNEDIRLSSLIGLLEKIDAPTDDQKKLLEVLVSIRENLRRGQAAIPKEFTTPGAEPFYFAWRSLANHYRAGDEGAALREARRIASMLREEVTLEVRNPTFVKQVEGFGSYTPAETPLRAGSPAMVYFEVENFANRKSGEMFDVLLKVRLNILDASGRLVREIDVPAQSYKARRKLTDYFHAPRFRLPRDLAPGRYILKVVVEDKHSERFTEERIEFEVK